MSTLLSKALFVNEVVPFLIPYEKLVVHEGILGIWR